MALVLLLLALGNRKTCTNLQQATLLLHPRACEDIAIRVDKLHVGETLLRWCLGLQQQPGKYRWFSKKNMSVWSEALPLETVKPIQKVKQIHK